MIRLTIPIFLILGALAISKAQAACFQTDEAGRKWITADNLKGTTTATIKQCNGIEYLPKISVNNPLYANLQKILFDSTYGGMRLNVNSLPDQKEPCLFLRPLVKNGLVTLQMYDASRVAADGKESCNP